MALLDKVIHLGIKKRTRLSSCVSVTQIYGEGLDKKNRTLLRQRPQCIQSN